MSLHLDFHILQSVPPSNLNRDETGAPKAATYGGARRARVSSQAWKRATRRDFDNHLNASEVGVRTKRAVELVAERIAQSHPEQTDQAPALAQAVLEKAGLKTKAARKAKEGEAPLTEYLVFFSNAQLDRLAELAVPTDGQLDAKAVKDAVRAANSFDLALFGRMVANDKSLNVDASCQVAHALSTHAVAIESDYFTAVDDENPDDESGAGMIGTVDFDSATLYRYATINVDALQANLGDTDATARAVEAFTRSFALSMPTGKQNTFANNTVPDAVVVLARTDRPVSLVGAFEDAVHGTEGFVQASCERLATHADELAQAYGGAVQRGWVSHVGTRTAAVATLGDVLPFDEVVAGVGAHVRDTVGAP